jgi:hypothetical protein
MLNKERDDLKAMCSEIQEQIKNVKEAALAN